MFGILKRHGHGGHKQANRHSGRHAHGGRGHHHGGGHVHLRHHSHGGGGHHNGVHWAELQIDDKAQHNESLPFLQLFSRKSNTTDSRRAMDAMTCPLCKNQCALSDPVCDKGRLYALNLATKEEG